MLLAKLNKLFFEIQVDEILNQCYITSTTNIMPYLERNNVKLMNSLLNLYLIEEATGSNRAFRLF